MSVPTVSRTEFLSRWSLSLSKRPPQICRGKQITINEYINKFPLVNIDQRELHFQLIVKSLRSTDKLLSLAVGTKNVNDLVLVELLHLVTGWSEVLSWVELTWLLGEDLADSGSHSET